VHHSASRRDLLKLAPLGLLPSSSLLGAPPSEAAVPETFPTQAPDLVREMVTVAHGNVKRVRELVKAQPTLAKAAWDWGFGDWETALGAASHMGNREIAEYLIAEGAHPTLFSAAMLGHLDVVKAFIAAQPGAQKIAGPHSISLLAHARAGGAAAEPVRRYLEALGDADAPPAAPLSDETMASLTGTYIFGSQPNHRIEISIIRKQLHFTRAGTTARGLVHLGDRVFHPAGASAVRIRFVGDAAALALRVEDPQVVLSASRSQAGRS
jgi:ankyrin repeat protein